MVTVQEVFTELLIPTHSVGAGRREHVVLFSILKTLKGYCSQRSGILSKCTPIGHSTAKALLDHGYKQLSCVKYWCPVQVANVIPTFNFIAIYFVFSCRSNRYQCYLHHHDFNLFPLCIVTTSFISLLLLPGLNSWLTQTTISIRKFQAYQFQ